MKSTTNMHIPQRCAVMLLALAAVVGLSVVPGVTSAGASTPVARTVTDCTSWHIFYGGQPEWQACITANDWYNGSQVSTNWNSTSCSAMALWFAGWSCQGYPHGHYWNSAIGANTDWLHQRIGLSGTITAMCANVNINTRANGYTWYSNSQYWVWPWQSC